MTGHLVAGCRHCGRAKVNRPRGLCWVCYHSVREQYPATSKFANRASRAIGNTDFYGRFCPAPSPTAALPGSAEKVEAMAERAAQLVSLWHPADARKELV